MSWRFSALEVNLAHASGRASTVKGMADDPAVQIQQLDPAQVAHFWTIELPQGAALPPLHSRQTYQGQVFEVMGILSFGDGHGPVLLAQPAGMDELVQA